MTRTLTRFTIAGAFPALVGLAAMPALALTLLSPTPDQVVREKVKITMPASALPSDFAHVDASEAMSPKSRPFISLSVENGGSEQLVAAVSPDAAWIANGRVTFYWDSKLPYKDPSSPREDKYYKDGRYKLNVRVHDFAGKVIDSALVDVELKNKVARPNPAPAVKMANTLGYGQSNIYKVHADVQVFQVVSGVGLPILGGMGMASDFKIIQTVEDIRPDGQIMLRYRMDKNAYVNSFGRKINLYNTGDAKPQLYRLMDKYGNVTNRNVFSRQGIYTIMDVLPGLPGRPVKEGDSWPTTYDLKIEGLTKIIPLTGTSMLDSFEWQNGHECAKIISTLAGSSVVSLNNGKIRSSSDKVDVRMVTYFAHKIGKMLRREVTLEFPALVMPGADEVELDSGSAGVMAPPPMPNTAPPGFGPEDDAEMYGSSSPYSNAPVRPMGNKGQMGPNDSLEQSGAKKGSVQIRVVVSLEK